MSTPRLWFPFYVNDWLLHEAVVFMSMESRGIYVQLLCHQWNKGHLPADQDQLRILAGCTPEEWQRSSAPVLAQFIEGPDGRILNRRLDEERQHADTISTAAKKSAEARWSKQTQSDGDANASRPQSEGNANTAQHSTEEPLPAAAAPESEDRSRIRSYLREDLFPYYLTHSGKNPKTYLLTDERLSKAGRRYVELRHRICNGNDDDTKRGMKHALDRLFASDFHMGLDPKTAGKKYNDWSDHVFYSWEKFEKWLNR